LAKLTEPIQHFIVEQLAFYKSPSQVAELVKEEFEVEVTRQLVRTYNPTQNPVAAKRWAAIFEATRKRFLETIADIPIANQAYRLNEIQSLYLGAGRNAGLKKELLEHAAKEVGGMFTNRREISGQGGAPIQIETRTNRQEWAETQVVGFMKEFKLTRKAAIAELKKVAPTVVQYLGEVG
jgi:hypothetical protein